MAIAQPQNMERVIYLRICTLGTVMGRIIQGCLRSDGAQSLKAVIALNRREGWKRAPGIEPGSTAWKAVVLPLNYARKNIGLTPKPGQHISQWRPQLQLELPLVLDGQPFRESVRSVP